MKIEHKRGDLFVSEDSLVHCVSEDLAMGKGIAVEFKRRFKRVTELRLQQPRVGSLVYLEDDNNDNEQQRFIFYLITKPHYWDKPTYESLQSSLEALARKCQVLNVQALSMPRIACGLDRLAWKKVEAMLDDIFANHATVKTITVYIQ